MQLYERIYAYIQDYQRLVYDYYSKHSVAFLVTYYNINTTTTIWDDEHLMGGFYEKIGELSGVKYDKYLLLPVYWIEDVSTPMDGQDVGYIKENETRLIIPSSYGITPYPNDVIKFEQSYLMPEHDGAPLLEVTGVEVHPNTDRRFWKLTVHTDESHVTRDIDLQVEDTYVFFDYDKKIHTVENAASMTRMLSKNEDLRGNLTSMWDSNSGFYFL